MTWIVAHIKWIMLISGSLTCTMIFAAIAPQAALNSTFGESLDGPVAKIVVRNWGFLITVVGAMLLYGAFRPPLRPLILVVAATGKLFFIALVLVYGRKYLGQAALVIVIDSIMVFLFFLYLLGQRKAKITA